MTLPIRWTEQAVQHLEALVEHISQTSPAYAEGMVLRIDQRLQLVRRHPELGKPAREVPDRAVRELVVPPYRVFYRRRTECIEILAIIHSRQDLPDLL